MLKGRTLAALGYSEEFPEPEIGKEEFYKKKKKQEENTKGRRKAVKMDETLGHTDGNGPALRHLQQYKRGVGSYIWWGGECQ